MTRVAVDDSLLERAHRASGLESVERTVAEALEEFVRRHEQMQIVEMFGTVDYDPAYDYKEQRRRQ